VPELHLTVNGRETKPDVSGNGMEYRILATLGLEYRDRDSGVTPDGDQLAL
jgi:hypothetical protein